MSLIRNARRWLRDERGITGLETAIILIAFVVVATVFAFVVLTTGIFSAERGKETVFAGLQKARGTMEVRGGIVAQATGSPLAIDSIEFQVSTTAGGDPIPLDPAATTNRTVIAFRSATTVNNDMIYTVTEIVGDGDLLVEPGELFTITLTATDNAELAALAVNERWTLEVQTPVGAVLDITRSLPSQFDTVMQLH
ncbi:MAG TPA: archaellin/type IV pilin N-terminal domain-containing protein [Dehalococcoidia bacterium]|jgi:flagellin FlaB|nr:archaellin/type IV pilin N-terminal domain-containing protein [Dehalococcoidia bacterium]